MTTGNMYTTDYDIIQPNYYLIYFDVLYNYLPNATDIISYFTNMIYIDHNYITPEYCEHIQDSIFQ